MFHRMDIHRKEPVLVIGVGNPFRSDDGAGLVIAERIAEENLVGVETFTTAGDILSLLDRWQGREHVIIFDAMQSGKKAGTVFCCQANDKKLPHELLHFSSHSFGINEIIALAAMLSQLPQKLVIYGIEGQDFVHGSVLSPPVSRAVNQLLKKITRSLKKMNQSNSVLNK